MTTSTSLSNGGFLYVFDSSSDIIDVQFIGTTSFNSITSTSGNGGTFYFDSPKLTLSIGGTSTFTNSYASLKGGLMFIKNALEVTI